MTPKNKKKSLDSFCQALKSCDHFLLSCHLAPEGDAIGSLLAMDSLLRRLGKKTTIVCEDPFPQRLSVLSPKRWNRLHQNKKPASYFQALVTTDCPTLERIGGVQGLLTPDTLIFNIDHHVSNNNFGHFNYVLPKASACGEVVYDIFKKMKLAITRDDAKNLYVAIMTDTGSFKYSNTTVKCHKIASELIAAGIDIEKINDQVYSTYSLSKLKLYSRLLSQVRTSAGGKIAWAQVKRTDLKNSGTNIEDTEGFIDFLKYTKEVKVAFFLMELPDNNRVRVSFRCKDGFDVNKIATYFNGGGHKKAAGCTILGTIQQAEKMILDVLHQRFNLKS